MKGKKKNVCITLGVAALIVVICYFAGRAIGEMIAYF